MKSSLLNTMKDEKVINLNGHKLTETHWIALHMNSNVTHFDSFGGEHVLKDIKRIIDNKNMTNIFRTQVYDS